MSQAQLAGPDFTKGFISLIENGRTRVSLRAAAVLAERLGVSVADLVSPEGGTGGREVEIAALRAEQQLAAGEAALALDVATSLVERAHGTTRARLLRTRGRALLTLARPREAARPLEDALRQFRATGQRELALRTMFDLAQAFGRLRQTGEALSLALECERALDVGELVDRVLELQVLSFIAAAHVALGDLGSADLATGRAIALAEDVADPVALGRLYASLALTREEQGDLEAALLYQRRSLEIYERLGQARAVAENWNTLGWIYIQRRQYARAAEALARAERLATEQRAGVLVSYVLGTRAELALARGDTRGAIELAQASAFHPEASGRSRGQALLIRAQAIAAQGAPIDEVRAAFDEAIPALEADSSRVRAKAHDAYAAALAERHDAGAAYEEARRAIALLQPSAV